MAVVSGFACSLSWWLRLQSEGTQVRVWIDPKEAKTVGDGLVQKCGTYDELIAWARDGYLAGEPTVVLFDASGDGDKADAARKSGLPVVGGCRFADKLEKDRQFGFDIAEEVGALLPPYESFESFAEARNFAEGLDDTPVFFKSDRYLDSDATHGADTSEELIEYLDHLMRRYGQHGKCILQKKIEGIPVSTARWWNGRDWTGPFEFTIEHKKFLSGDVGPSTGCALNAVWFDMGSPVLPTVLGFDKLTPHFLKGNAAPGIYDMNSLIGKDGNAYFLEWTPRLGYDSEITSVRLLPDLSDHLYRVAYGRDMQSPRADLAYGLRLGVPPYPWEHSKKDHPKNAVGTMISGEVGDLHSEDFIAMQIRIGEAGYEVASPEALVGMTYAEGGSIEDLAEKAEAAAKKVRPSSISYRKDGAKVLADDAKAMKKAGFDVHKDLL